MRQDPQFNFSAKSPLSKGAFSHFGQDSSGISLEKLKKNVRLYCLELLSELKLPDRYGDSFFKGKMLRSSLTGLVGHALEVDDEAIIGVAAAIELLHEASLAHDDIQDRQYLRRNRPTLWRKVGVNQAINVGDLLQALAYRPIIELKSAETHLMIKHLNELVSRVVLGQIIEQDKIARFQTRGDYEEIVLMKTGALIGAGPELLALHMGETIIFQKLRDSIWHLSLAFQLKNDLNDMMFLDESLDLKNKVVSMPIILLLEKLSIINQSDVDGLLSKPTSELIKLLKENKIEASMRRLIASHVRLFRFHLQKLSPRWSKAFFEIEEQLFAQEDLG